MKRVLLVLVTVCLLILSGCASSGGGASSGSYVSAGPAPTSVRSISGLEEVGVIFEWSSETAPLQGRMSYAGISSPVPGINFQTRNSFAASGHGNAYIDMADGGFLLTKNMYLIIGGGETSAGNCATLPTTDTKHVPGVFNFSEGLFRLTIDYKDLQDAGGDYFFRAFINNNTSSYRNSVLAQYGGLLRQYTKAEDLITGSPVSGNSGVVESVEPNRLLLTIKCPDDFLGAAGSHLATSFISMICFGDSSMIITGLKLERIR